MHVKSKTFMKIALIGYGKMGKMIEKVAISRGHEIVSIIDIDNPQDFCSEEFASADVAIEFTTPQAAFANYQKAFAAGVKVVSGSTGWMKDHREEVLRMVNEEGNTLFWASNFSVGVAIFSAVNRYLATIMNGFSQYTPTMKEVHHIHKLDKPSGTAITLAEEIVSNIDRIDNVPIDSIREGEVPGIHSIKYDSAADSITITHDAHTREGFALGAVLAAEYTKDHTGLLSINDMFKFS